MTRATDLAARAHLRRPLLCSIAWALAWCIWVGICRHNHPNLGLSLIATTLLVVTFAAAVLAGFSRPHHVRDRA